MAAVVQDHTIEQGATWLWAFRLRVVNEADPTVPGTPYDLTGWTVRMQIRRKQQEAALVSATTTNGKFTLGKDPENEAATPDPTNGWVFLELTDEDTDLLAVKTCVYDVEVETPAGRVYRLFKGTITVDPNVTQEADDPVVVP